MFLMFRANCFLPLPTATNANNCMARDALTFSGGISFDGFYILK